MRRLVLFLILVVSVLSVGDVVEAATNSSSLPVPPPSVVPVTPTPVPTVVPTPTPVLTAEATPTPTPVAVPVTASDGWTYALIVGGIAACVFAAYKVNLKGKS